jgi:hypothetical protein
MDHPRAVVEARASHEIGGWYRILRWPGGGVTLRGDITETTYDVEYARWLRSDRWDSIDYPRGEPGTLSEAKQMAEEDHAQRRREAATVDATRSEFELRPSRAQPQPRQPIDRADQRRHQ